MNKRLESATTWVMEHLFLPGMLAFAIALMIASSAVFVYAVVKTLGVMSCTVTGWPT